MLVPALSVAAVLFLAEGAATLPMQRAHKPFTPEPGVGATPGLVLEIESPRERCSRTARQVSQTLSGPAEGLVACNQAIADAAVMPPDQLAGTHVNRGVLLMAAGRNAEALRDFDRALSITPGRAEAYVNRGAILIGEGRAAEGVADLDRGIALGPEQLERAHYNRAIGREMLGDVKGAYFDYRTAAALNPAWEAPALELTRFQVKTR